MRTQKSQNGYIRRVFIIIFTVSNHNTCIITVLLSNKSYRDSSASSAASISPGLTFAVLDRMENTGGTMWLENKLREENWVPPQISNILRFEELLFLVEDLL